MKKNPEMRLFLLSMLVNIITSFLIGYKYKDNLIAILSPALYYQVVVFLSLLLPHVIKYLDKEFRFFWLNRKIEKLKREIDESKQHQLDEKTREMFNNVINNNARTSQVIKDIHDELESMTK
ncbi:hypothetical protein [Pantoea sp. Cy-640]|uniref:hypothetical protein n=1 Tax=Pantoea sp. Cy-640 TaxID=2608353 RepID=UPI00141950B9|nr:hypothetical protein [Pantoea sp. Cy-640]NIG15859.1 hypothetical protein [Pantoea sp. Cy-640]